MSTVASRTVHFVAIVASPPWLSSPSPLFYFPFPATYICLSFPWDFFLLLIFLIFLTPVLPLSHLIAFPPYFLLPCFNSTYLVFIFLGYPYLILLSLSIFVGRIPFSYSFICFVILFISPNLFRTVSFHYTFILFYIEHVTFTLSIHLITVIQLAFSYVNSFSCFSFRR